MRVVLATHNQHKVDEFQKILGARMPGLDIVRYDGPEPVEDGTTFAENALIKAKAAALHTGLPALADDSGLSVDILGGAPGIFSARWAGHGKGDRANRDLLLDQLADIHDEHREGAFVCTIALVVPERGKAAEAGEFAVEEVASGFWRGMVVREARGEHGFGYDPVFQPAGSALTAAELAPAEKNAVSHRALAFENLLPILSRTLAL
ncbi:RdgB/HAM1 family non-canonical purine NTP pyrophosphatase [Subtercola vilae]|uniref:dITP/XTP pyrophosphatase n=1 Tax=Subtercola vilae TaxID=2056433 RepID=A0A4T2BXF3_9MICO|nr:RdgB/HAM1 family non-canonical purine NTP pyrophosphatase [Subtercola vilae]